MLQWLLFIEYVDWLKRSLPRSFPKLTRSQVKLTESQKILVLILGKDNAVEVAADEVAEDDAAVDTEDLPEMEFPE